VPGHPESLKSWHSNLLELGVENGFQVSGSRYHSLLAGQLWHPAAGQQQPISFAGLQPQQWRLTAPLCFPATATMSWLDSSVRAYLIWD